jgi:hypothetical protein
MGYRVWGMVRLNFCYLTTPKTFAIKALKVVVVRW